MQIDRVTKILSHNVKTIRRKKGLTTIDFAKILDVSQAKISYIEHCKGVLSARDVAILSRRLNIPITEFYQGISETEDTTGSKHLAEHLARYGAVLLSKSSSGILDPIPFEDIFARALGFIENDRLHKGFCTAIITQAAHQEINIDRIFALIGNNPFLTHKVSIEAQLCLKLISTLNQKIERIPPRAQQQVSKILNIANSLLDKPANRPSSSEQELLQLKEFVEDCLNAKK